MIIQKLNVHYLFRMERRVKRGIGFVPRGGFYPGEKRKIRCGKVDRVDIAARKFGVAESTGSTSPEASMDAVEAAAPHNNTISKTGRALQPSWSDMGWSGEGSRAEEE